MESDNEVEILSNSSNIYIDPEKEFVVTGRAKTEINGELIPVNFVCDADIADTSKSHEEYTMPPELTGRNIPPVSR